MNKKTLAVFAVLLLSLVAVLAYLNLSKSERPKDESDLISGEDFQSEKLKLNEPDPSKEDFKSIGDIGFDEKEPSVRSAPQKLMKTKAVAEPKADVQRQGRLSAGATNTHKP